jgi:Ycf66 protein N-terminus
VVENMLAYILAVLVGTGSVGLYIAAFFFPEMHRKQDFIWSGVGFFYALTLWIYARQSMGGIVVGQTASVALLGWFAWQTLKLRRQLVPANQQTPLPDTSKIQQQLGLKQTTPTSTTTKSKSTKPTSPPAQTMVEVKPSIIKPIVDTPPAQKAVEVKPSIVKPIVDTPPAQKAVEVKPSIVKPIIDTPPAQTVVEVKPSVIKPIVDTPPAQKEVEVKPSVVKPIVDTPPAPPIISALVEEEEKASITLQLEPPATAAKPLGQPVRPPAPPEPPQQGILAAGAIVEVVAPQEDRNTDIDLELQSIPQSGGYANEPIVKSDEDSKDESSGTL